MGAEILSYLQIYKLLRTESANISSFISTVAYSCISSSNGSVTLLEYKIEAIKLTLEGK